MAVRTATPTTGWLLRGTDGRLTAWAAVAGGVLRWTETRPGGPGWTGPQRFDVPGLEPRLSIARTPQGYVHLAGLRRRAHDDGRAETDVVYTTQFQSGLAMTPWRSIGTPYGQDWQRADQIGAPTVVVDSVGAHIVVRNAGGGVCARRMDVRGAWGPWTDIKGSHVLDTVSAAVTDDGRIELLAPAEEFVLRWRQEEPGGPLRRVLNTPAKPLAGSASSAPAADGRIAHYWRSAADGVLHVQTPDAGPDGAEAPAPVPLTSLGGDGQGPVASLRTELAGRPCTILAQRAPSGRPAVTAFPDDAPSEATWQETGEPCVGAPTLTLDAANRVVLATITPEGGLRVARQKDGEPGLALGEWERA
ncbi:hypothetical protein GCM10010218_02110 [Streptomyces mashuensis]|uniref:Uncharacterized protein n=1 Tax=Streptomyces mashuensis TaxID=33904 RepID=A0A919E8F7_9ACTN|nr:hypothetical protein [Streptomyces mashuensis]GHF25018.1 hypothetical protein GCM10010218_02110 [Streptomyces mashuensis]